MFLLFVFFCMRDFLIQFHFVNPSKLHAANCVFLYLLTRKSVSLETYAANNVQLFYIIPNWIIMIKETRERTNLSVGHSRIENMT